jgi:integrase
MLGGIYTDQRCKVCGCSLKDDGKRALSCENHHGEVATRFKVIFKGVTKRFKNYESAQRFLTGLRYKSDEGTYDERDYKKENPLGFENLAIKWLQIKEKEVKKSSYQKIENHIYRAIQEFKNRNIKEIGYSDIEDLLLKQKIDGKEKDISGKTRSNIKSSLHSFWVWLKRRHVLNPVQVPEFPEVKYELSWRKVIDKKTQDEIIEEVGRISSGINPKIWLGIKWLSRYISIRPGEMLAIKEGDFDLSLGVVIIPHPKEKRPKTVPLLDEDIEILKAMPRGLPDLYFFRHSSGLQGVKAGERFGEKYLYKYWKKACENLGIDGVDLYGGTRHSSARALREFCSPEQIKRATMHTTNKAFERYFQIELDDVRQVYQKTNSDKELTRNSSQPEKAKVLNLFSKVPVEAGGG